MKENKLVVVITINYNQSKMSLECIDSILKSSYKNYKIVLVDNGSKNSEFEILKANLNSSVIVERIDQNCGYVGGVNRGLNVGSKYEPEYFLIMNNDTVIDRDAVHFLADAGERYDQNAIISGKVYHFDLPEIIQYTGSFFSSRRYLKETYPGKDEKDEGQLDDENERDMLDDIFWLLPRKIYLDIGDYSDNFFLYAEQADYALRAVKKGYKLIYTPKAKIWHKGSLTSGGGERFSPPVNFWRKKSMVIYLYRNTLKIYFLITIVKTLIKSSIKNILNLRNTKDKKSEYAALVGYLYGIKWIFNKKPDSGHNPFIKKS
jgi:GT2 family glycosyltransferase